MYQIYFYVPETHLEEVKEAMFAAGAGKIGAYDFCAWQVKGEGQFRPLAGSHPALGELNKIEKIAEYKVEMVCTSAVLDHVIEALHAAHPYEVPAYGVFRVEAVQID